MRALTEEQRLDGISDKDKEFGLVEQWQLG